MRAFHGKGFERIMDFANFMVFDRGISYCIYIIYTICIYTVYVNIRNSSTNT